MTDELFIRTAKTDKTVTMNRPACIVVGVQIILFNSHKLAQHWLLNCFFNAKTTPKTIWVRFERKEKHNKKLVKCIQSLNFNSS